MNHRKTLLCAAIGASFLSVIAVNAQAADFRTTGNPVPGQYIVVLKTGAAKMAGENSRAAGVAQVGRQIAAEHRAAVLANYDHVLRGFAVKADDAALARLLADPRVAYVEEDGYVSTNVTQSPATWGLDRIDQRNLPLNNAYNYSTTAPGVHAYIIDTGVLGTHTQFTGRMGNGYDAIGGGTTDCNGHGSHVAGTVGGTTWGVAKGVTIHPVRVLGCTGSGTWTQVINGMNWVAANRILPAVANMSLGGGANSSVDAAVQTMVNAGVTVVVAAGNNAASACNYSPARAAAAITVGSTDSTDARSSFSNFGTCVDIFAPGSSITSAWYTSTTATNTISGTSMASPHVAGAAALYLAGNPGATPAQVTNALIAAATTGVVINAGTGSPNRLLYTGSGSPPANQPPVANFTATVSGLTASFTDASTDSDGSIVSRSWNFGDGTTSTVTNPSKTYAAAGTYTVTLTVTDNAGATSTKSSAVTVTSGGTPPVIDWLSCPSSDSGGGTYICYVGYTSSLPVTITWNGSQGSDMYMDNCFEGQRISVTVTVSNSAGSASRTSGTFLCPTNPIP